MTENKDTSQQTFRHIFPASTSIIDFAYSELHPLRVGEFSIVHDDYFLYKEGLNMTMGMIIGKVVVTTRIIVIHPMRYIGTKQLRCLILYPKTITKWH